MVPMLRSVSFAALLTLASPAAAQDTDVLYAVDVTQHMKDGKHLACSLAFQVRRGGEGGGRSEEIGGSLMALFRPDGKTPIVGLKLAYRPNGGAFTPPARAWLVTPGGTNEIEEAGAKPTSTGAFMLIAFDYGPQSREAMAGSAWDGMVRIGLERADGSSSSWSIDLGRWRDVQRRWVGCLEDLNYPIDR